MKVQLLAKTEREIKFIIEGTNPQFANALRRVLMGEIAVLAVDSVDFHANSSALYDETLSHRLAMIPLKFDPKAFVHRDDCKCNGKGCSNCQIVLVLDKKAPGMVYGEDIKSADPKAASVLYSNTPIVELFETQKLKVDMTAIIGYGKDHAKWQGARVGYKYYPIAEVKGKIENPDDVAKACPHRAISFSGGSVQVSVDCEPGCECGAAAKPEGSLKVVGDDTRFVFYVESVCGLDAEEVVFSAVDMLKEKLKEFSKQAGKL